MAEAVSQKKKRQKLGSSPTVSAPSLMARIRSFKVDAILAGCCLIVFAAFSGPRFLRQSAAPHFVHQANAFLHGNLSIPFRDIPNLEDWACVRESAAGTPVRCEGRVLATDTWYSSFPWMPAVVMMPFVAVFGTQFNDTSFGVLVAALGVAFLYRLLRNLATSGETDSTPRRDAVFALLFGFGSLYFYAAIRGEVWFSAEVMGVAFTALYLMAAVRARRPVLAGLFFACMTLTRTPLAFSGIFFLLETLVPTRGQRLNDWRAFLAQPQAKMRLIGRFALGAAPLAVLAATFNYARFGSYFEFGHSFLFVNRVSADIDKWGLFSTHYVARNLDAAFLLLPSVLTNPLRVLYNPFGMSLFITTPLLALAFSPATQANRARATLAMMIAVIVASGAFGVGQVLGERSALLWLLLVVCLGFCVWCAGTWLRSPAAPRLLLPVLVTLVLCALPGFAYQNTGYAQYGFRFSIDYTPYIFLLVALGGWSAKQRFALGIGVASILAGTFGAVAFRGLTEVVHRTQ